LQQDAWTIDAPFLPRHNSASTVSHIISFQLEIAMNTCSFSIFGVSRNRIVARSFLWGRIAPVFLLMVATSAARAEVPTGSKAEAEAYYKKLSTTLNFSTPAEIANTTLTDVAAYMGYPELTAARLEFEHPASLMWLGAAKGDVLVTRFFEPKIMNVKYKEGDPNFKIGWRKLVRLRSQPDSPASKNSIAAAVILFNWFNAPGVKPFGPGDYSLNNQVMLLSSLDKVRPLGGKEDKTRNRDTFYWMDYKSEDPKSTDVHSDTGPGKLGYALNASFEADTLPGHGTKDYFIPHACIACHGNNVQRPFLNFLDTDHAFDRLNNDFTQFRDSKVPVLYDAGTNDTSHWKFREAFDLIRQFNKEADDYALAAQPKHDETISSKKWVDLHDNNYEALPLLKRVIGTGEQWSDKSETDLKTLDVLNQYCYRCHGTVKFSVFNKQSVWDRRANFLQRIDPKADAGFRMPPDRELPQDKRDVLIKFLNP
jgi:hypothetical protein